MRFVLCLSILVLLSACVDSSSVQAASVYAVARVKQQAAFDHDCVESRIMIDASQCHRQTCMFRLTVCGKSRRYQDISDQTFNFVDTTAAIQQE